MSEQANDFFANAIVWGPNGREDSTNAVAEPPAASVAAVDPPSVPEESESEEVAAPMPPEGEAPMEDSSAETEEVEAPVPSEPERQRPRRPIAPRLAELAQERDGYKSDLETERGKTATLTSELTYYKQRFEEMAAQQRLAEQPPPQVPQDGLQRTPQGRPMRPAETAYATTQDYEQALMQYEDALLQWHGQQVISAYDQQRQAQDGLTRVREKYPDFDQVISTSRVSVNNDVGQAIQVSGMQHELLYHLATHPQAAQALAYMQGPAAYLAIGELRASLRQPAPPSAPPPSPEPPPRVTPPAPPPIAPTRAASARAVRNYDEMSWEEFEQVRNKEEQALRR